MQSALVVLRRALHPPGLVALRAGPPRRWGRARAARERRLRAPGGRRVAADVPLPRRRWLRQGRVRGGRQPEG
eukprot:7519815-Lingulodinium_polyedra.AAC.1